MSEANLENWRALRQTLWTNKRAVITLYAEVNGVERKIELDTRISYSNLSYPPDDDVEIVLNLRAKIADLYVATRATDAEYAALLIEQIRKPALKGD